MTGPLRPRDAATLILVRDASSAPKLLMGRRGGGHVFMPGKWVFPGGRLHPSDYRVPAATELAPETATALAPHAPGAKARALALAAVRETFEEAGLLLAKPAVTHRSRGTWRDFLAAGALPDLAPLRFVGRAVTPPGRTRRFDARFFMADADALVTLERRPDCGELEHIDWLPLDTVRGLDLPTVTRLMIDEIAARLSGSTDRPIFFPWGV